MLIVVDAHSGVPVYRQLMDQIRFHIASGLLSPGDELPSTRALSAELGVNPMTISKAYSYLERDRVVERRPGRPLVVAPLPREQLRDQKLDQLREHLAPTVTIVRQLEIDKQRALEVFREMLAAEEDASQTGGSRDRGRESETGSAPADPDTDPRGGPALDGRPGRPHQQGDEAS